MIKLLNALVFVALLVSCNDSKKKDSGKSSVTQLNTPADSVSAEPYLFTDKPYCKTALILCNKIEDICI